MTRKGASSTKPSRDAATTVHTAPAGKAAKKNAASGGGFLGGSAQKREQKQQARERRDREAIATNIELKKDPRYGTYRRIWWILLGAGLAMTIVCWLVMIFSPDVSQNPDTVAGMMSTGALIAAYVFILAGFVFDWIKVRPMRRKAEALTAQMSDKKLAAIIEEDYLTKEQASKQKKEQASSQKEEANKQIKETSK